MAYVNSVPKLYRSVIEDVIEGVRDLFAEEGIEEQVLKDLKQLWETKVLQSKATEDFFRNSVHSPLFTLQLPHSLHQTLQSSTASLVIPAGRTLPSFTTAELGASNSSANFTFPGYPIHVPADVTLQTASGHLYKVNVPIMVTQASGRASILQHPIQVFQQLGQPSVIQTSVPRLNPCSLQATTEKSQRMETVFQQPTILHSGTMDRKPLENATSDILVTPGNEHKIMSEALLSQPEGSQYISLPGVVFPPQVSQTVANGEPLLRVSANVTQNLHGGPLPPGLQGAQHQHMSDVQLHVLKNRIFGYDCVKQPRRIEEPSSLSVSDKFLFSLAEFGALYINDGAPEMLGDMWFCRFSKESIAIYFSTLACINAKIQPIIQKEVSLAAMKLKYISTKDSNSQMDLSIQGTDDDINEIIQIDGTGDTSSNDDIGSSRDVDENEFLGIIDGGDLKVLEEADSISNGGSTANSSDNEDPQIDIVEEDPLNSGDDVSEQDAPDLFDTDNVIVCQYDKIHRSKNKWKFYLKDGVMCFGGRDYVFAKAIGDAEW